MLNHSGQLMRVFFLITSIFVSILARESLSKQPVPRVEFHHIVLVVAAAMMLLVESRNFVMLFVALETLTVGLYILVSYYRSNPRTLEAGLKYVVMGALSSALLLFGIVLLYGVAGSPGLAGRTVEAMQYAGLRPFLEANPHNFLASAGIVLVLSGFAFKIGAVPFQIWIPDVYQGAPTPVSYTHLDVYKRQALYAALCAVTQRDIKKVLAYSTLSQLGYMVAAFGLGSVGAAMFHLTTHAFFKALLFLGSGSVILACHHEQDIFRMGGLRRKMPLTFWTFTIAVAAIIGLPGLAGFFSKDAILALAYGNNPAVFAVLAFTAVLTAFYMLRLWKIVFLGNPRSESADHAHESGISITAPLVLLAALSIIGGYTHAYPSAFEGVFSRIPEAAGATHAIIFAVSIGVLVVGAGTALAFYATDGRDALEEKAPAAFRFLGELRTSFDSVYDYYVAKIQQRGAMILNFVDIMGLGGLVVRGLGGAAEIVGFGLRALHTGRLSNYVYWFLFGVVVFWAFAAGVL